MTEESVGAVCTIKWRDTQEVREGYYIKFGKDNIVERMIYTTTQSMMMMCFSM